MAITKEYRMPLFHLIHCTRLTIMSTHTSYEAAWEALHNLPVGGMAWHNIIAQTGH